MPEDVNTAGQPTPGSDGAPAGGQPPAPTPAQPPVAPTGGEGEPEPTGKPEPEGGKAGKGEKGKPDTTDYKARYQEEQRRRAGLDRKVARLLKGRRSSTPLGEEGLLTGDEAADDAAMNHPLTQRALAKLADMQLKDGVREILGDYPHVPENIKKAISAQPRGFISDEATTVDQALEDIESYILDNFGVGGEGEETPQGKQFPVAGINADATDTGEDVPLEQKSAEELEEMLDRGEISLQDLESVVKKMPYKKGVKKLK